MFELSQHLWEPQRRGVLAVIDAVGRGRDVVLQSPTGSGKTQMAIELMRWAEFKGWCCSFFVNRKLLVGQTSQRLSQYGIHHGIRAADYDDRYDASKDIQISSVDTEMARVYRPMQPGSKPRKLVWPPHEADLVIVDEAHIQKGNNMKTVIRHLKDNGCAVVLLTATPIGLHSMADELVVAGTMGEFRHCKAIVPAVVKTISNPDMNKVKRNKTGEYVLDGRKKAIYTQSIVGDVLDRWKRYNPDGRPSVMYAPGVDESVWLTDRFQQMAGKCCHGDATEMYMDGERQKLTRDVWDQVVSDYKSGRITMLSSRMKLREGIDVPETYCCILATPIGSLASYIQTVGRVLRYSDETSDRVVVIDHGGNYLRHGSPNVDRPWKDWWKLPERAVSEMHTTRIKDRKEPEPIRCPECEGERITGTKCPHCGHQHEKSRRRVQMENGTFVEKDGELIKPRNIRRKPTTEDDWERLFWAWRKKETCKTKTFNQLYGFFVYEHHYDPPRDLRFMPKTEDGWYQTVGSARMETLNGTRASEEKYGEKATASSK